MAERLISIQDTNQFQTLCGSFDENLKLLEQRYHVRMICRGEELRIQGDGAQVELAAGAVTALLQMISNGQAITPQSIHYVSDMVDAGSAGQLAELADDDTVCLTAAGKPVHTRTVGQRSYVRAIAENTIVFGLGLPAPARPIWQWLWQCGHSAGTRSTGSFSPALRWKLAKNWDFSPAIYRTR